jgi:hypothetical protein
MVSLVAFGFAALVGHWSPVGTGIVMLVWLACSCLWLLFCACRALNRRKIDTPIDHTKTL